jgi:hypothetical protein
MTDVRPDTGCERPRPRLLLSDFAVQQRGRRTFDVWAHTKGFDTSMGRFDVECIVDIAATPSRQMLDSLEPLLAFTVERTHEVLLAVHAHYLLACRDTRWMQELQLPIELAPEQLVDLLIFRSVSVCHRADDDVASDVRSPYMHLIPAWDEEHALYLGVRNGAVVRLEK